MVERSDQSVNSLPSTTPQHNILDVLAEAALGLRLDHDTASRRDRVPGLRRWYPLDAGSRCDAARRRRGPGGPRPHRVARVPRMAIAEEA